MDTAVPATAAPEQAASTQTTAAPTGPDLNKMSGIELKEYFENQKKQGTEPKKEEPKKESEVDKYFDDKKEETQSSKEIVKEASEAAKEEARKHRVKVNGQELEVDEDELKRGYSHQKAANKMFQEGKKAKQQAEEFINLLKDPQRFFEVAEKLGHNPRDLTEKYLAEKLQDDFMDPREKELKEAKMRLKQYEDLENKQKEEANQRRIEEMKEKFAKDYNAQFVEALQKTGVPQTKEVVAKMAGYIHRSAKIGFKMNPLEAAQLVREDIENYTKRLVGESDGESLIKLLGEDVANKIRKYDTSKLKNPEANLYQPKKEEQGTIEPRKKTESKMSHREWRNFNRG